MLKVLLIMCCYN